MVNKTTIGDKFRTYLKHPGSLVVMLLVMLAGDHHFCRTDLPDRIYTDQWCAATSLRHFFHWNTVLKMRR